MFRPLFFILLPVLLPLASLAQSVGIGTSTPNTSALLDLTSYGKGLLLPRMTTAQRVAISSPATGLFVYQTDGLKPGFYYNAGSPGNPSWQLLNVVGGAGDNLGNHTATQALNLQANALTGTGTDLGTTVGVGVRADGGLNLGQNTPGNNVSVGYQAGASNTTGLQNQFSGYQSGYNNTTGTRNQLSGYQSGYNNNTGNFNQFSGGVSGFFNTTGSNNTFNGYLSGFFNTTGSNNTALGYGSGPANILLAINNATALGANVSLTTSNTVVLGSGANVGIGTSAPGQKLEVVGNVQIPAVSDYRYATAKPYTVTYGAADFQPERDGDRKGIANNGGSDELYAFGAAANFRAAVHLPQGATITGYTVYYNDTQAANLTVSLLRLTPGTPATTTGLATFSTGTTAGYGSAPTAVAGAAAVVDNAQHYYLRAQFPVVSAGLAVSAVVLTYTITAVE